MRILPIMGVIALFTLPGCFATREEMFTLKEDLAHMQEQLNAVQEAITLSTSKMKIGQADIYARLEEVELGQEKLRAKFGESDIRADKLSLRLDSLEADLANRLKALEEKTQAEFTVSANTLYETAYADYARGNYALAIIGFREYLTKYKDGTLADSAQYWIGECFLSQQDYQRALEEFEKTITQFPHSQKLLPAKYKMALAYIGLKDTKEAGKILAEIIEQYPQTNESKLAKEKKKELKDKN